MKFFLNLAVVILIHGNYATLVIKGPTKPVPEGQRITLECLYKDSDLNISQVRFETSNKPNGQWFRALRYHHFCIRDGLVTHADQIGNSLFFPFSVSRLHDGRYRCVSTNKNVTAPDNSSQELRLKVHYLDKPDVDASIKMVNGILSVKAGDDVVVKCDAISSEKPTFTWTKRGSDWILPSSTMVLKKINPLDAGLYTCLAEHPIFPSLSKNNTIYLSVFDWRKQLKAEDGEGLPWYKTSSRELWATMATVAVCFVVFILSISIFLCCKFEKACTSKGPI